MFGFDESKEQYEKVYNSNHKGNFTHEVLAGAVSFEALKAFENKQRNKGEIVKHAMAKEIIAGFAGAEADKLFESKGLDYLDREMVKKKASDNAKKMYESHYESQGDVYDPSRHAAPSQMEQYRSW